MPLQVSGWKHPKWILSCYWLKTTLAANRRAASCVVPLHRDEARRPDNQVVKTAQFYHTVHTLLLALFLQLWEPLQLASLTHILFASFSMVRMSLPLFVTRPPFLILAVWHLQPTSWEPHSDKSSWQRLGNIFFFFKYYVMTQVNVVTQSQTTCLGE